MYKIIGTRIKVQIDIGTVELESIDQITTESREALETFFNKWKILSVLPPRTGIVIPLKPAEPKLELGVKHSPPSSEDRIKTAMELLPQQFSITDWMRIFNNLKYSSEDIKHIKKAYNFDIKKLISKGKIIEISKGQGPYSSNTYKIIEPTTTTNKEKEEAIRHHIQERESIIGTIK